MYSDFRVYNDNNIEAKLTSFYERDVFFVVGTKSIPFKVLLENTGTKDKGLKQKQKQELPFSKTTTI